MFGIVTRNAEELAWEEFSRGFYEVKDVTGRQTDPQAEAVNMVSCHGDSVASEDEDVVPIDDEGNPATRDRPYFDWGYACPTHPDYREGLLDLIDTCADVNEDVRLDDVGFPRAEYCFCERCSERFAESDYEERREWRASVITAFLADARDRIPGRLYLTLYPNPYPGHLTRRSGIDLAAIEPYVDEFVIPLYDMAYTTTYWLEIIAHGFEDALETPFGIELYAVQVDLDNLTHASEVAGAYARNVYFGYDAGNARGVVRRLEAEQADGATYGDG